MDAAAPLPGARLGVWPAAFFLFCFVAYELVYREPANPRALALAIALYSYAMWFGMAAFGRRQWDDHANGFTAYPGCSPGSRHSASTTAGSCCGCRLRASPAATRRGLLALIAVMLGSVGFDGLSRSPFWIDLRAELEEPYILDAPRTADLLSTALGLAGLVGCVLLVAAAYRAAVWGAHELVGDDRPLENEFLLSLVPIALVYAVAHYFTYLVIQGQYAITLASDPFGRGWDICSGRSTTRPISRRSRPTRSGTSSSGRSSQATLPASRSRTTGPSRSSPSVTRSAPSTPCWR